MLHITRVGEEAFFQVLFNDDLWKEIKKYMFPGKSTNNFYNYTSGDLAIRYGYLSLMKSRQLNYNNRFNCHSALYKVIEEGNLEMLKFVYNTKITDLWPDLLNSALYYNQLEIVKFLIEEGNVDCSKCLDIITGKGYIEIVEFLHNKNVKWTEHAIKGAVKNGHLEVVKFLYNNSEECQKHERDLIGSAAINDHLQIVKFLYHRVWYSCDPRVLKLVIENGNTDIVIFLILEMRVPYTMKFIDIALEKGYTYMAKILENNI